ncbi:MAG: VOC family protein [Acidimicrobiales bacterium]
MDALQPQLETAIEFYGVLLGWTLEAGIPVDGHWSYNVAKSDGDEVGGIAPLPPSLQTSLPAGSSRVRVDSIIGSVKIAGVTAVLEPCDEHRSLQAIQQT